MPLLLLHQWSIPVCQHMLLMMLVQLDDDIQTFHIAPLCAGMHTLHSSTFASTSVLNIACIRMFGMTLPDDTTSMALVISFIICSACMSARSVVLTIGRRSHPNRECCVL